MPEKKDQQKPQTEQALKKELPVSTESTQV